MSRKPVPFKQADVTRAIKAARAAGMQVGRFEVFPGGRIAVYADTDPVAAETTDDVDQELAAFREKHPWYKSN